jgi:hypothetical protein
MNTFEQPFRVEVTAADIEHGEARDCYCCPAARAIQRATGDDTACVESIDWGLHVGAHGRIVRAPLEVSDFVDAIDAEEKPAPFSFELPPIKDWQEQCAGCEGIFEQDELDGEGYCEGCRTLTTEVGS